MPPLVKINNAALQKLLSSEQGPVMRDIAIRATRVQGGAQHQVGVDTAKLKTSIVKRFVTDSKGPGIWIGSEQPHALLHHEGTRPHVIVPRKGSVLVFVSKQGQTVFARRVNHPGTKPNRYLVDSLPLAR